MSAKVYSKIARTNKIDWHYMPYVSEPSSAAVISLPVLLTSILIVANEFVFS